ncbi:MAG: sigma 54-interacting transcriptional regulator [Oscillospiraceae bacterium]|nr:sigma 54-interacting transcriptional regulator [Oscillospiraceae bacterium]
MQDYKAFYELMLDNFPEGVYILDGEGNYIYANTAYIHQCGVDKTELLSMNVHDWLKNQQIDVCISDIVFQEKRRVVMFQDVAIEVSNNPPFRQMVISSPIFGASGKVEYILAVCRPLDTLDALYHEANSKQVAKSYTVANGRWSEEQEVVAESLAMRHILQTAREIADIDVSVLITGESGTGKEVVAQCIHNQGKRNKQKMVVINCAALPENLLEAELFGYEKGAFTGASPNGKAGLFELASGGTLFLDEINSLPIALQGKLLRAIETKTVQRIGSTKSKQVDFRLISATNENLFRAVEEKRFRADLFYRLNVIPLELAPLRERKEDIVPLALYFLQRYNRKYNKSKQFSPRTLESMLDYDWGGNVRELKNFVERSVVMTVGDYIDITNIRSVAASHDRRVHSTANYDQHAHGSPAPDGADSRPFWEEWMEHQPSLDEYMDRCEREYLSWALDKYKTTYMAAKQLGTSQSSIMRRKTKYGL